MHAHAAEVAISYAHGPRDQIILDLANRLNREGVDCEIDLYQESPPEGWARWMTSMMTSRIVIVVCDETYYRRFRLEEAPGTGLGATFESGLLVKRSFESQGDNKSLIPVLLDETERPWIPEFLRDVTRYLIPRDYQKLYARLTGQTWGGKPPLGPVVQIGAASPDGVGQPMISSPALLLRPRLSDPHPMLASDRMVPEGFVYVRLLPEPADEVPIITATLQRLIASFVKSLPGLSLLEPGTRQGGVIFSTEAPAMWRGEPPSIEHYGGQQAMLQRAKTRCWVRSDGDVEVRLPEDDSDRVQQVLRALGNAYAIARYFGPLFGADVRYGGKLSYKLSGAQHTGFEIADEWETWLKGDLSEAFDVAFLGALLEAQSAGHVAGDADEMRKLLLTFWRNDMEAALRSMIGPGRGLPAQALDSGSGWRIVVSSRETNRPISRATVAAVADNGTVVSGTTDAEGIVLLKPVAARQYTLLLAHPDHLGETLHAFGGGDSVQMVTTLEGRRKGSVIGLDGTGHIPGLDGRLNPILDSLARRYLYAENISINDQSIQPVNFTTSDALILEDARGARCEVFIRYILGRTFLVDYTRL